MCRWTDSHVGRMSATEPVCQKRLNCVIFGSSVRGKYAYIIIDQRVAINMALCHFLINNNYNRKPLVLFRN